MPSFLVPLLLCLFLAGCAGPRDVVENARFELQQHNTQNAIKILEKAKKRFPQNPQIDSLLRVARPGAPTP